VKSLWVKNIGEHRDRWDAGFRSPLLRFNFLILFFFGPVCPKRSLVHHLNWESSWSQQERRIQEVEWTGRPGLPGTVVIYGHGHGVNIRHRPFLKMDGPLLSSLFWSLRDEDRPHRHGVLGWARQAYVSQNFHILHDGSTVRVCPDFYMWGGVGQ
jgi:hypothetical protein